MYLSLFWLQTTLTLVSCLFGWLLTHAYICILATNMQITWNQLSNTKTQSKVNDVMHIIDGHIILQIWIFTNSFLKHTAHTAEWLGQTKCACLMILKHAAPVFHTGLSVFFLLQGDRFHQAAAETVPQAVLLLLRLLHSFLSQNAL